MTAPIWARHFPAESGNNTKTQKHEIQRLSHSADYRTYLTCMAPSIPCVTSAKSWDRPQHVPVGPLPDCALGR